MEGQDLLPIALFAEADKSSRAAFERDASAIAHVFNNRMNNPKRWGATTIDQVITQPNQVSSVGSPEWEKAASGNLTKDEEWFYKKALQIRYGLNNGTIVDPTGGADHYYNSKIAKPSWGNLTSEDKVKQYEYYYPETYKTGGHSYRKETMRKKKVLRKSVHKT